MSFITDFEAELTKKLEGSQDDTATLVKWVTEKVLESYRNGITAGRKGETVKRPGQSRRQGVFGKAAAPTA